VVGGKRRKKLQILGYLAWGSFLYGYMQKEKPRPKWPVRDAFQRWTLKGVNHIALVYENIALPMILAMQKRQPLLQAPPFPNFFYFL